MAQLSSDRLALLRAVLAEKGLAAPRAGSLPRRASRERAPLSQAQERLFFLELLQPGTALHNDAVLVELRGPLDPTRLAQAVSAVAARHEVLRTGFELGPRGPEQVIDGAPVPQLRRLELPQATLAAARELARREARQPFDLAQPPWRIALARIDAQHHVLVLTMHHLISDGASMGLFLGELGGLLAGAPSAPLPELPVQFGDFAAWERASAPAERIERDLAWWRETLGTGLDRMEWRAARGRASQVGAQAGLEIAASTLVDLARQARSWQATPNHVLLAAWLALLQARAGTSRPCSGIASSLRTRRELEPLIGFFVQSLPLCVSLEDDPSFRTLVERVRTATLAAASHAAPPFERILREAGGSGAGPGGTPALQAFFSHMRDAIRPPAIPGVEATWEFVDPGIARFELALVLHESEDGLRGFLEHDLGLFPPESGAELVREYARLLGAGLAEPERRLSELLPEPVRRPQRRFPFPKARLSGDGA